MHHVTSAKYRDMLESAYRAALKSKDPSTQNGAVLVDYLGNSMVQSCNNFPNGVDIDPKDRWERPLKYKFIEHAERNSIYNAARRGIQTQGMIMACPWAACSDCARGIIQAGIKMLVTHKQAHDRTPERWREEIEIAFTMLKETGVEIAMYDGNINDGIADKTTAGGGDVISGIQIRHNGELWSP